MNISNAQQLRKSLDIPFWSVQASWVTGVILMPSLISAMLYGMAVVLSIVYIVRLGCFAKEIGGNPSAWSLLTLLFGPLGILFSYIYSFDVVRADEK